MDGTLLPRAETQTGPRLDGRKGKQLSCGGARWFLARPMEAMDGAYAATFGTVQLAGVLLWRQVAETAGLSPL